jgi:hypothetical protein
MHFDWSNLDKYVWLVDNRTYHNQLIRAVHRIYDAVLVNNLDVTILVSDVLRGAMHQQVSSGSVLEAFMEQELTSDLVEEERWKPLIDSLLQTV